MIEPTISIKGKITTPIKIQGKTNASIIKPKLETAEVTPGTEDQTLVSSVDGFSTVLVKGDANLLEENIKSGITIFGKEGKSANTADATAVSSNLDKGVVAYTKNDVRLVGTGKVLDSEVVYTVPYVNKYDATGLGKVISTSEYLPIVYHGTYALGGDMGVTKLFPVSKLPTDILGKNIMFRVYFKRPTYRNSPHYYLTAELYIASSMDNRFEVRRDSSNDLVWCWNNVNKGSRVSYTYYVFSKYLGNSNNGEVSEGTIDDITSEGWETGTTTSRGSYSSSAASMYKFCSKDMVSSGGLAGMSGYVGRGDDCFLQTTFGSKIGTFGGDYKIQDGGTLITRIPNEDVASAIGLVPENIKEGARYLGVDGAYKGIDTADATATAGDVLKDKTAYANGGKITGTIETYDGSYEGDGAISGIVIDEELWNSMISIIDKTSGKNTTKLPEDLTSIGKGAFYLCSNLKLTELPNKITSIGKYAFHQCTNLALTKLPDGIITIDNYAFQYCTNITISKLPETLTSIGAYCFEGCSGLSISELPSGITEIPSYSFNSCDGIVTLKVLGEITSIGNRAFGYCENLTDLIFPNVTSVPTLNGGSAVYMPFYRTPIESGTGYIYVPDSLVDSFKTATNWSTYADQIKSISELEG